MKNTLKKVLNLKVHSGWFILSCVLLGGVLGAAGLMARDLSSLSDKVLNQSQWPAPLHARR